MLHLTELLATRPFPAQGVHGANENSSNVLQRSATSLYPRSREYLTGGYTYDFVIAGQTCALQQLCIHQPL